MKNILIKIIFFCFFFEINKSDFNTIDVKFNNKKYEKTKLQIKYNEFISKYYKKSFEILKKNYFEFIYKTENNLKEKEKEIENENKLIYKPKNKIIDNKKTIYTIKNKLTLISINYLKKKFKIKRYQNLKSKDLKMNNDEFIKKIKIILDIKYILWKSYILTSQKFNLMLFCIIFFPTYILLGIFLIILVNKKCNKIEIEEENLKELPLELPN